jgi:hypothetical protein
LFEGDFKQWNIFNLKDRSLNLSNFQFPHHGGEDASYGLSKSLLEIFHSSRFLEMLRR